MSYIKDKQQFVNRRHSRKKVDCNELIHAYNRQVDDCNEKIAAAMGQAQHWLDQAALLDEENARLRTAIEEIAKAKTLGDARGIANKMRLRR